MRTRPRAQDPGLTGDFRPRPDQTAFSLRLSCKTWSLPQTNAGLEAPRALRCGRPIPASVSAWHL